MFRYLLYSSFHLEPMSISKTAFFGAEEFISPLTDVPRRLRECSIFRKKSWKILDLSMTPPSHFKLNLLMSTVHRSPLADDQKKQETTTDDTHQPWRLGPTTTALTQQPTWDSRRDFVDILRERRSINRRRRTVDCCVVAFTIAVFLLTHHAAESIDLGSSATR